MKKVITVIIVLCPFVFCSCFIDNLTGASKRIEELQEELNKSADKGNRAISELEKQKRENDDIKSLIPKYVAPNTNKDAKSGYESMLQPLQLDKSFWVEDRNGNLEFPSIDNEVGTIYRLSHKSSIPNYVESITGNSSIAFTQQNGQKGGIVLNVTCTKNGKVELGLGSVDFVGSKSVGQLIVGRIAYNGTLKVNDENKKNALIESIKKVWEPIDETDSNIRYYYVTDVVAYEFIIKSFDTTSYGGSINAGIFNVNGNARAMYYTEEVVYKVYKKFAEIPYYRVHKDLLPSSIQSTITGLRQENVDLNDIANVYLGKNKGNALFDRIEQGTTTFGEKHYDDFKSTKSYQYLIENEFREEKDKKKLETILNVIEREEEKSKGIFDEVFKKVETIE